MSEHRADCVACDDRELLMADNHRLRELIADACRPKPWQHADSNGVCPWCNGDQTGYAPNSPHAANCPAFTEHGVVK
jgi:hypothetical protein